MSVVWSLAFGLAIGSGALFVIAALRGVEFPGGRRSKGSSRSGNSDDRPLVEGLAVWIEQLRDMMAGARGLEQALSASATTAPSLVRPAVERLSANLEFQSLPTAARGFASDVNHPLADFVAAVLITTSRHQARDVVALLTQLAETCRDEVSMRTRVWVSRARTRSAVRIISVVVVAFIAGLFVLNRDYLAPYSSAGGTIVLVVVISLFAGSFVGLRQLAQFEVPPRFVAASEVDS